MSYNKYQGGIKKDKKISKLKHFHNCVRIYFLKKNNNGANNLLDIGSGRGAEIDTWIGSNIKYVVGIEPSKDSIRKAIKRYMHLEQDKKKGIRIRFIRGVGNKPWNTGDAALDETSKDAMIHEFGKKKAKFDRVDLFWTIHYMMDTQQDMQHLMDNIDRHTKSKSYITILCMDGDRILDLMKENDGVYRVMDGEDVIFQLTTKFDHTADKKKMNKFGNTINVLLYGAYGLGGGIDENLVFKDSIIEEFTKKNFKLKEFHRFLDIDIPERAELKEYERKVSDLYVVYGFEKWN